MLEDDFPFPKVGYVSSRVTSFGAIKSPFQGLFKWPPFRNQKLHFKEAGIYLHINIYMYIFICKYILYIYIRICLILRQSENIGKWSAPFYLWDPYWPSRYVYKYIYNIYFLRLCPSNPPNSMMKFHCLVILHRTQGPNKAAKKSRPTAASHFRGYSPWEGRCEAPLGECLPPNQWTLEKSASRVMKDSLDTVNLHFFLWLESWKGTAKTPTKRRIRLN